jgi:hypothetical protein
VNIEELNKVNAARTEEAREMYRCPLCGASPGLTCRTKRGKVMKGVHPERKGFLGPIAAR